MKPTARIAIALLLLCGAVLSGCQANNGKPADVTTPQSSVTAPQGSDPEDRPIPDSNLTVSYKDKCIRVTDTNEITIRFLPVPSAEAEKIADASGQIPVECGSAVLWVSCEADENGQASWLLREIKAKGQAYAFRTPLPISGNVSVNAFSSDIGFVFSQINGIYSNNLIFTDSDIIRFPEVGNPDTFDEQTYRPILLSRGSGNTVHYRQTIAEYLYSQVADEFAEYITSRDEIAFEEGALTVTDGKPNLLCDQKVTVEEYFTEQGSSLEQKFSELQTVPSHCTGLEELFLANRDVLGIEKELTDMLSEMGIDINAQPQPVSLKAEKAEEFTKRINAAYPNALSAPWYALDNLHGLARIVYDSMPHDLASH